MEARKGGEYSFALFYLSLIALAVIMDLCFANHAWLYTLGIVFYIVLIHGSYYSS